MNTPIDSYIILLRHGESYKNLKSIHGGPGERLTPKGVFQTQSVAQKIKDSFPSDNISVFSNKSIHTSETATILSDCLNVKNHILDQLLPLNMGVFSGLSDTEMKSCYPDNYESLLLWRKREIEISQLNIPEMENLYDFWKRGETALESATGKVNIFVLTNSLFILFVNILLGRSLNKGSGYKHVSIKNCDMVTFIKLVDGTIIYSNEMSDIPLCDL